ncbi:MULTISPECIES: energy transducer TonB family protein [unclassified Sulfuricurvum]|uniref:energy transducer TonB family protein n=1 Tax=unclassified Sulfuricurvum TaxID=2632390 RepID=UPI000A8F3AB8|nr:MULTISPECIES: TonB C-terminal domain-containing protein [unclassified Sulfuricurvum]
MKRTESFSLYAFIIAFLVHLIIALLLILLNHLQPETKPTEEPEEERFRLSLKEYPDTPTEALVPNTIPKVSEARSIPRGEQLEKPSAAPRTPPKTSTPPPPKSASQPSVSKLAEPEPKKAFERHVAKPVAAIERQPKKEQGLYDILSKADPSAQEKPLKSATKISDSIERLYGDKFSELSEGEQKYIIDNQEIMRRITQGVLDRYGRSRIPDSIRVNDTNMIEFYLHPDGSISDIRFLKNSRLSILDDTTKEVIELAYAKYPRPQQKTLIRYRVWYNLTGY